MLNYLQPPEVSPNMLGIRVDFFTINEDGKRHDSDPNGCILKVRLISEYFCSSSDLARWRPDKARSRLVPLENVASQKSKTGHLAALHLDTR